MEHVYVSYADFTDLELFQGATPYQCSCAYRQYTTAWLVLHDDLTGVLYKPVDIPEECFEAVSFTWDELLPLLDTVECAYCHHALEYQE